MTNQTEPKRRGRGPGKKPALACTSIRLSQKVMEYFGTHHPHDKQAAMRRVLDDYVDQQLKEPHHGTQETDNE